MAAKHRPLLRDAALTAGTVLAVFVLLPVGLQIIKI